MSVHALLRFGPLGTAVLLAFPTVLAARYVFGRPLAKLTVDRRELTSDERTRLQRAYKQAELPVADTLLATNVGTNVAGLGGTPWARMFVLSESTLENATADELEGLVGIAAGQHAVGFLERYALVLVACGIALVVLLGIDPAAFESGLVPLLLVLLFASVPFVGFAVVRHETYAADTVAVDRVGEEPVKAAISFVDTGRLPDWVPTLLHPKPSAEERIERLRPTGKR